MYAKSIENANLRLKNFPNQQPFKVVNKVEIGEGAFGCLMRHLKMPHGNILYVLNLLVSHWHKVALNLTKLLDSRWLRRVSII